MHPLREKGSNPFGDESHLHLRAVGSRLQASEPDQHPDTAQTSLRRTEMHPALSFSPSPVGFWARRRFQVSLYALITLGWANDGGTGCRFRCGWRPRTCRGQPRIRSIRD